jgi:hypothetical protein
VIRRNGFSVGVGHKGMRRELGLLSLPTGTAVVVSVTFILVAL